MRHFLFFDTETTGIPANYNAKMTDLDNWPRVIQLAFCLMDEEKRVLHSFCELIKPDGWEVPKDKFWIENGFSTEKCQEEGVTITEALRSFIECHEKTQFMVAHNMQYDFNVLGAELIRASLRSQNRDVVRLCTKEMSTNYCKLPGKWGKYKWPSLTELHNKLFDKDFEGAHDAFSDIKACADCFFELWKRGVFVIDTPEIKKK